MSSFKTNSGISHIEELCLSGAVHKGILYVGAFKYLEELGILNKKYLKKIIGTSIGSFVLACYVSGYTISQLVAMILEVDFAEFKDQDPNFSLVNLFAGHNFHNWVSKCLGKYLDPNITIGQFYEKFNIDFIIVVVSLENGLIYVSKDTRPHMSLFSAIMASMNVPFVFPPYQTSDGLQNDIYVDGGLLDNFAIHLLGPRSFGITPVRKKQQCDINDPISYFLKMTELIGSLIKDLRKPKTEYIMEITTNDTAIIDFDMSKDSKITMYFAGYNFTKNSDIPEKYIRDFWKDIFNKVLIDLEDFFLL